MSFTICPINLLLNFSANTFAAITVSYTHLENTHSMEAKEIIANIDVDINNIPVTIRNSGKHYNTALNRVLSHYSVTSEKALFIEDKGYIWALAMVLDYLDDLILTTKLMLPVTLNDADNLIIDSVASSTLELTTSDYGKDNTLL